MIDIAVVILIGQEKIHLKRCVEKLAALSPRVQWLRKMTNLGPLSAAIRRSSSRSESWND